MKSIPDLSLKTTMTRAKNTMTLGSVEKIWVASVTVIAAITMFLLPLTDSPVSFAMTLSAFYAWIAFASSLAVVFIIRTVRIALTPIG
jgi:hypothetical protein